MTKSKIAALVAVVLILVKVFTGVEVGSEQENQIIEVVMSCITGGTILYGVYKTIKK